MWEAEGAEGFTIDEPDHLQIGTDSNHISQDDTEDLNTPSSSRFKLETSSSEYSDYIHLPSNERYKERQKPASEGRDDSGIII